MKNKYIKWLTGGLLGLMAVFCLGSCSDDHYDLNTTNATGTLYDNLAAIEECDSFLMILDKAIVNKKSYGTPASLTYGDLLKGTKALTVWAPKNGTYNAQYWLDKLDEAAELDAAGDRVGAAEAYKIVEKQFAQNHLSYFNYSGSYPETKRIALANGKYAVYDVEGNTIKTVPIATGEKKNIPSVNGTVHVLEGSIDYAFDLREIIDATPELSHMHDYIVKNDTLVFMENMSTEGSVVEGKMQYVDSFFYENNKVMPSIANRADSLAAALYYTNDAWDQAIEHIKTFFQYKDAYSYVDERGNVYTDSLRADSLQEAKAVEALFKNTYYSLYEQKGFDVENASVESVKNFFETADSLVSTEYYYRNHLYHQHAPECNELTDHQTPIEASNGYAFILDNFNFKANRAWQFDLTYEIEGGYYLSSQYSKSLSTASPTGVRHAVSEGNRNPDVLGYVSEDAYQEFVPSSSAANPQVALKMSQVLSGTYDVYVVIVPENITDAFNTNPKANKFTATLTYDYDENGQPLTVTAEGPDKGTFVSDVTKVDSILLFQDFKFPTTYYQINNSQPMLTITSALKLADRKTCTPNLNIDCILLVAKDE
ncbi:MAG: hypothetical protein IJT90_06395 [Bacteroidaceae bacterium]|nr:hypothetical protein [Bacteroidaceae bacterium]